MINKPFIQAIITESLGCTTIWANQNDPKPAKPFATLRLYDLRGVGMYDEKPTATAGEVEVKGNFETTLEVLYLGTNAEQNLIELKQGLKKPTVVDRCFGAGVAFFDAQRVQDLTVALDAANYEEKASINLSLRYVDSIIDNPGYISQVNLTMNKNYNFTVEEEKNG